MQVGRASGRLFSGPPPAVALAWRRGGRSWLGLALWLCFMPWICLGSEIQRAGGVGEPAAGLAAFPDVVGPVHFDLPAQPLRQALKAYSQVTGVTIIADDALLQGVQAKGVHGERLAGDALVEMLQGTELQARYASAGALTLVRRRPAEPGLGSNAGPTQGREAYAVVLQRALKNTLCAVQDLRPGTYRVVVQLWMDRAGTVSEVKLVGSTEDAMRDARLLTVLKNMRTAAVPSGVAQPLVVLLQGGRSPTQDCQGSMTHHG